MKFRELPIGAKFRFHRRGLEHTKDAEDQFRPDVEVVYEEPEEPNAPAPHVPTGRYNRVELLQGEARLDGTFTAEQLEAVLVALKKRKG
ncbi:hypothetical protein ACQ858_08575 [Variovorax ureilyticus]|uniref:hypothetical protein n=1 Tax=Variovorax ureilyticus TaxID=1836198 RepID=UPI003D675A3F